MRASVVGYLSVIRGVEGGMAKLGMGMVKHPALERAERLLRSAWRQVRPADSHVLQQPCICFKTVCSSVVIIAAASKITCQLAL